MDFAIILFVGTIVFLVVIVSILFKSEPVEKDFSYKPVTKGLFYEPVAKGLFYEPAGPLLTAAENNFYLVLEELVPSDYVLTFKVRIGDVLKVRKGLDKREELKLRSKVQQKHFDFVVCRKKDKKVVCCIELNDSSHNRADRKRRDEFVRAACKAAGIPLLEVKNRRYYVKSDLKRQLNSVLFGDTIIDIQNRSATESIRM